MCRFNHKNITFLSVTCYETYGRVSRITTGDAVLRLGGRNNLVIPRNLRDSTLGTTGNMVGWYVQVSSLGDADVGIQITIYFIV